MRWTGLAHVECFYLPTCIDKAEYGLERRSRELARRYGIEDRTVIMTAGRLDETNKGFDEVIDALPDLRKRIPNISYLIMGDGQDKDRLLAKARRLGVADLVVFTGYVPGAAKADHYRLADVFAMPGSSPGFDRYPFRYVFLEALACGVPVVGCKVDDPKELNDPDSQLIIQVDPKNRAAIVDGILAALSLPRHRIDPRLSHFYFGAFRTNLHRIVSEVVSA
jgi:glycosyltransferase involved in cell wall biosynthesis